VLSDEEARQIEQDIHTARLDPHAAEHWIRVLLDDRRERIAWLLYLQRRLRQAFSYLNRLCEETGWTTSKKREGRRDERRR
jgi:hypothetical protein